MKIKTKKENVDFLCTIAECHRGPDGRKIYNINLTFEVENDTIHIHEQWVNRHYDGEEIIESEPYDSYDEAFSHAYELPAYIETISK